MIFFKHVVLLLTNLFLQDGWSYSRAAAMPHRNLDRKSIRRILYFNCAYWIFAVMSTTALLTSGATSSAIFSVAVAPLLFFVTSDKRQRRCFFSLKSGSASALFFKQIIAAAATANKFLPRLFQFTFSHVTVWSLYSSLVFTLLLLPCYFSLIEHARPL